MNNAASIATVGTVSARTHTWTKRRAGKWGIPRVLSAGYVWHHTSRQTGQQNPVKAGHVHLTERDRNGWG